MKSFDDFYHSGHSTLYITKKTRTKIQHQAECLTDMTPNEFSFSFINNQGGRFPTHNFI